METGGLYSYLAAQSESIYCIPQVLASDDPFVGACQCMTSEFANSPYAHDLWHRDHLLLAP